MSTVEPYRKRFSNPPEGVNPLSTPEKINAETNAGWEPFLRREIERSLD